MEVGFRGSEVQGSEVKDSEVQEFRGSEFRNLEPFLKIFKGRTKMCGCCRFTIARNQNL